MHWSSWIGLPTEVTLANDLLRAAHHNGQTRWVHDAYRLISLASIHRECWSRYPR